MWVNVEELVKLFELFELLVLGLQVALGLSDSEPQLLHFSLPLEHRDLLQREVFKRLLEVDGRRLGLSWLALGFVRIALRLVFSGVVILKGCRVSLRFGSFLE